MMLFAFGFQLEMLTKLKRILGQSLDFQSNNHPDASMDKKPSKYLRAFCGGIN